MSDANNANSTLQLDRRRWLKLGALGSSALALAASTGSASAAAAPAPSGVSGSGRAQAAARLRSSAAQRHYRDALALPAQPVNGDERRYARQRYYASFTKALPSNDFGEVQPGAFRALVRALRQGRSEAFDAIALAPEAARGLVNPQAALKFNFNGLDSHACRMKAPWRFRSAELAGEVAEVYWQALTRDVPFLHYEQDATVAAAVADLNALSATPGLPGPVTPATVFRGETPGDLTGPYISQFLLRDFRFGPAYNEQRYDAPVADYDFMRDRDNWLNVQRGGAPLEAPAFEGQRRYLFSARALAEYVHRDLSFQAYLNAALVLLGIGRHTLAPGNPYRDRIGNQEGFASLGDPYVVDLVSRASNLALACAWYQKWREHRLLRPEAYGGRVHFQLTGQRDYELHPDILNSAALEAVFSRQGSYFLPQAYPEGSPVHPSCPAGHATMAGACVTVLKALFDERQTLDDPVQADATGSALLPYFGADLTIGGELNKLANNIALGRDAAGVHYRQDGIQGLLAGEQQAIALLRDESRALNERGFDGFEFTAFDGRSVRIRRGEVR